MSGQTKSILKSSVAFALAAGLVTTVAMPAQACWGCGGAFAAGLIGGTALGVVAGSAAAAAAAPPPPPPGYYAPAYAGGSYPPPPPRCWIEPQQVWDGYAGAYVVRRVRVCQ